MTTSEEVCAAVEAPVKAVAPEAPVEEPVVEKKQEVEEPTATEVECPPINELKLEDSVPAVEEAEKCAETVEAVEAKTEEADTDAPAEEPVIVEEKATEVGEPAAAPEDAKEESCPRADATEKPAESEE